MEKVNITPPNLNQWLNESDTSIPVEITEGSNRHLLKFISLSVVALIFAGVLILIGYQFGQKQTSQNIQPAQVLPPTPSPTPEFVPVLTPFPTSTPAVTTIPIPTSAPVSTPSISWKTYNNENYGYVFKYPANWFGPEDASNGEFVANIRKSEETYWTQSLEIQAFLNSTPDNLDLFKESTKSNPTISDKKEELTYIDDVEAWSFSGIMPASIGNSKVYTVTILVLHKNVLYQLVWTDDVHQSHDAIFNQILLTFNFSR